MSRERNTTEASTSSQHSDEFGPTLVEAVPEAGFNYPYYLSVPPEPAEEPRPILVEPTNTGRPTDDFEVHLEGARRRVEGGSGRRIADALSAPFLHPVFPRPAGTPVDWTHSIHQLDAETMAISDGPLARVDLQLLAMVDDARERLADEGHRVPAGFMLNGFSASGTFANRFAALHPERVISVSAGGINGMAILPRERADNVEVPLDGVESVPLDYPVGVANIETMTGKPFDLAAFCEVNQFLYIGGDDDKDALLYPDAWTDVDLRGAAILTYGDDIHDERFPCCRQIYDEVGASAVFRVYGGVGHNPEPAECDIIEFHERSLAGEEISDIRTDPV